MTSWLSSERIWLNALSGYLLDGDICLVRAVPRWGLTSVCKELVTDFNTSAVMVEGRLIKESNQKAERERIDREVTAAVEANGCAQLIFDDYGHAIGHSQGGTLHSMLYRLLIDSPAARDAGALLVARSSDSLDLDFSGSPLVSRARTVVLPTLSEQDADEIGIPLMKLMRIVGNSTWLARRFLGVENRQGCVDAVEHLNHDRRKIIQSLPSRALEVLAGATPKGGIDTITREALTCLGTFDSDGSFRPARLVSESHLLDEVNLQDPGWPCTIASSVRRFAHLLAGTADAIWIDRYLFAEPWRVRRFIIRLQSLTAARLRLLVSDDYQKPKYAGEIASAVSNLQNVQVRFMNRQDRGDLHDRHLVLPDLSRGYVLPTAGVILGADNPGSAVSVPIPTMVVDYQAYWNRGIPVYPLK